MHTLEYPLHAPSAVAAPSTPGAPSTGNVRGEAPSLLFATFDDEKKVELTIGSRFRSRGVFRVQVWVFWVRILL